jgi:hypothetical protein
MNVLSAAALLALLAASPVPGEDSGWTEAAKDDGVTVYSRSKPGSNIQEMKAVGLINAPPEKVWAAIRDYAHYRDTMPYTRESRVVSQEDGGKVVYFYSVVNAPLVSDRDYVIRIVDESDWHDGQGYFKASWKAAEGGPPPVAGRVRVVVNDGYWVLLPQEGGKKTLATYYVYTDPGGSLPKFIANKANGTAVPNVFKSIRKTTAH